MAATRADQQLRLLAAQSAPEAEVPRRAREHLGGEHFAVLAPQSDLSRWVVSTSPDGTECASFQCRCWKSFQSGWDHYAAT